MFEVTSAGANSCVVCSVIIKSTNIKKILNLKEMCMKGSSQFITNKVEKIKIKKYNFEIKT